MSDSETVRLTEFSGVVGQILHRSISMASLLSGLVLLFILFVGNWVLLVAGTPNAVTPFTQIVIAMAMARFAINGRFGEWSGTVLSCRGGSWFQVVLVATRYLALTALWLIPMVLLGPTEEQMQAIAMMGPAAAGKLIIFAGVYLLAMALTPPVFLIVAAAADGFGEMFSADHWRGLFRGRLTDLFVIYAIYTGGVGMVLVLSIPLVILGFLAGNVAGVLAAAGSFCLLLGLSANLLGRLCGFFACGDLSLASTSPSSDIPPEPSAHVRRPTEAPSIARPLSVPSPSPLTAGSTTPSMPLPVSGAAAPALASSEVPEIDDKRPPLMDSQKRVEALMARFTGEPQVVTSALEELEQSYAASPAVLQALCLCKHRTGQAAEALELARRAVPLCLERGNTKLVAVIFRELRGQHEALGLSRDQIAMIAGVLAKMDDPAAAARAYTILLTADPGDIRAIKGLLQVGEQILRQGKSEPAKKVFRYLLQTCPETPLTEYIQRGLEEAERR